MRSPLSLKASAFHSTERASPVAYYDGTGKMLTARDTRRAWRGRGSPTPSCSDRTYSREELVAEMGAAFLCGHCGIDAATVIESSSYIASWLRAFQNDTRMVVLAAVLSQKAAAPFLIDGEERLESSI